MVQLDTGNVFSLLPLGFTTIFSFFINLIYYHFSSTRLHLYSFSFGGKTDTMSILFSKIKTLPLLNLSLCDYYAKDPRFANNETSKLRGMLSLEAKH